MSTLRPHHGHLYLADLRPGHGTEPDKLRPVLVIQTDLLNEALHPSTWVLPCTTKLSDANLLRVRLPRKLAGNQEDCDVMIDQSRAIDNRRLAKHLGFVPSPILKEIKEKLRLLGEF